MITLHADKRTHTGKQMRKVQAVDTMPAVIYGPKHESEAIVIKLTDFTRILRDEGESSVVEITGMGAPFQVLIHEVDRNPVTGLPRHADFYAIKKGAKVNVAVPITFVGESPAVKAGASLVKVMHELEIESDPANLPHDIEVDISTLVEIGDQIHVSDIKLPKGVVAMVDAEEVVVLTQEVAVEAEEPATGPDMDAIEVEKKGKDDSETDGE
jgi:large subunit ribosomal protein L25